MILDDKSPFYSKDSKWTVEKVEKIQRIMLMCNPASLDQPITRNDLEGIDFTSLSEMVEDPSPSPEDIAIQNDERRLLLEVIEKCLDAREIKIIKMRFGFEGLPMTLEEIGKHFKVTRERIRQVEAKALKRIRGYMIRHEMFKRSDWNVE